MSSEGHARSRVQGESTVSSCDMATSVDLCPHPVTTAVFTEVEEGERSAPKARDSLPHGITSAPSPLLSLEH